MVGGVVRHVAMFAWKPDVGADHQQRFTAALDAVIAAVPNVVHAHHGPDVGINPSNLHYVVTIDFATPEDYLGYRDHPQHRQLVAEFIADHAATRAAVQFSY